jgi:hypothetical protein
MEDYLKGGMNTMSPLYSSMSSGGSTSADTSSMDRDLLDLFASFNLESIAVKVASELGLEVASDFSDIQEGHITNVCKTLGLKPVQETRLKRLFNFVHGGSTVDQYLRSSGSDPKVQALGAWPLSSFTACKRENVDSFSGLAGRGLPIPLSRIHRCIWGTWGMVIFFHSLFRFSAPCTLLYTVNYK